MIGCGGASRVRADAPSAKHTEGSPLMRIIIHLDMDAFFAAVEERQNPDLRGRPLVIGADPKAGAGRGVVATASYAARRYGIRSALPISRAWRLAEAARRRGEPETVFLRGNHRLYREVSGRIMGIAARTADAFEEASIDEAYLDVSSLGDFARAVTYATALKAEIVEREGLTSYSTRSRSTSSAPSSIGARASSGKDRPSGRRTGSTSTGWSSPTAGAGCISLPTRRGRRSSR
jgi:DNA polymerase IV (archaeal DinB-like DNA polymerase)